MAETFTMNEAPANPEILNSDEQESLAIADSLEQGEQPLLAGKFKDPQALEQAYVELQKKLGEPRDEVPAPEDEGEPAEAESEAEETDDDSEGLSEEQAEMLMDMVGGDKAYKSMLDWAAQNFSKEEIEMYDGVMGSGNANAIYYAIQALQSRFRSEEHTSELQSHSDLVCRLLLEKKKKTKKKTTTTNPKGNGLTNNPKKPTT